MTETRFAQFSLDEIQALWEGLLFDGGARYDPEPGTVEEALVKELERESVARAALSRP